MKIKIAGPEELKKNNKSAEKKSVLSDTNFDPEKAYTLNVGPAEPPKEQIKPETPRNPLKPVFQKFHSNFSRQEKPDLMPKEKTGDKVWSIVRFVSTSAIIFIILFFAMNWNAYQAIIFSKLGWLKPSEAQQQMLEKLPVDGTTDTNNGTEPQQDLLEVSKNPEEQKNQIPPLNLEVTPPDTRIIISRINRNVPVVTISTEALINKDWDRLEQEIQEGLQDGVVHYPGTAFPGEKGNVVITGHSSYFVWDPGRFKDVFALLHQVEIGDRIYVYYQQKKYTYEVVDIKVVLPTQVDVLTQAGEDRLTLITCTPVGTNLKRLVVLARPV